MAPGEISPTCKVKNAPPMDDSTAATQNTQAFTWAVS